MSYFPNVLPVLSYIPDLRIDTSGWALCQKNGDISRSDQGILLTHISNESILFSLSYDISHM